MTLWGNLFTRNTRYQESSQELSLKPGENHIGNAIIILSQTGKVLQAKEIKRQITKRFLGFRDFRTFLATGTQFFSLLGFCIFFLWYERQPKTRYLLKLKRYTWGLFAYVSLWFVYWVFFPKPSKLSYLIYYLSIYIATGITFIVIYYLYRYYRKTFKRKHSKLAGLVSYIFDIRHKNYPRMASRALERKEGSQETFEHVEEYEKETFAVLDKVAGHPEVEPPSSKAYKLKLILIGVVLSIVTLTPLLHQFVPEHIEYVETEHKVSLKPGANKVGDVILTIDSEGRVVKVEKTERHNIHEVFGFENLGVFLVNIGTFLTSLLLCTFFSWYEKQEKNPYVVALKWWTWSIFFLVALYFIYWTLIPKVDPISDGFYYIGSFAALALSLVALYHLYGHYMEKLWQVGNKLMTVLRYLFQVRNLHFPRMVIKALGRQEDEIESILDRIRSFDVESLEKLEETKNYLFRGRPDLKKECDALENDEGYLAYLVYMGKIIEKAKQDKKLMELKGQVKTLIYILQNHRENYTKEEIQQLMELIEEFMNSASFLEEEDEEE